MQGIRILILSILLFFVKIMFAQNDTLVTKSNTILVGEIKEMVNGVVTLETSYSDKDFKIEWLEIRKMSSERLFRVILINGILLSGKISMFPSSNTMIIEDEKMGEVKLSTTDIVNIKNIGTGRFLDILNLKLDVGYSFTNVSKLKNFNSEINFDYYREIWGVFGKFNTIRNFQEDVTPVKRSDGNLGYKLFFMYDIFASITGDFFSSNEQQLDLRSNYDISIGKYFIHTNQVYLNSSVGLAYSFENYAEGLEDIRGFEGKFQVEFNMFDLEDLNMFSSITLYPSLSQKYRLRTNISLTIKYDLPRDFYIKMSYDLKYDTKPYDSVEPNDYVFTTGIGWEL